MPKTTKRTWAWAQVHGEVVSRQRNTVTLSLGGSGVHVTVHKSSLTNLDNGFDDVVKAAVLKERERCAQIAEGWMPAYDGAVYGATIAARVGIAEAIRKGDTDARD